MVVPRQQQRTPPSLLGTGARAGGTQTVPSTAWRNKVNVRYRLRTLLVLITIVGAVCAWVVPAWMRGKKKFLIESETPGTMVFSGHRFLGETPLWVYESQFPGYDAKPRFAGWWTLSTTGVGLWDNTLDQPSREFWFVAPEGTRHQFLHYETPYGEATRTDGEGHWGGRSGTNWFGQEYGFTRYEVHFQKLADNEGLVIEVSVPAKMPAETTNIPVTVTVRNSTQVTWSAVDDPPYADLRYKAYGAMTDGSERISLNGEASRLDPGETCTFDAELQRTRFDRPAWNIFADIRYHKADEPVPEKPEFVDYARCSNGVLVLFEP